MKNKKIIDFVFFEIDTCHDGIFFKHDMAADLIDYADLKSNYSVDDIIYGIKNFLASPLSEKVRKDRDKIYFEDRYYNLILYYQIGDYIIIRDIDIDVIERLINETNINLSFIPELKEAFKLIDSYNQFSDEMKLKLKLEYDI